MTRRLLPLFVLLPLIAADPSDLAPGAPDLHEAEQRLRLLLDTDRAVAAATSRLQVRWAVPPRPAQVLPPPPVVPPGRAAKAVVPDLSPPNAVVHDPLAVACDAYEQLALGWRIEHFGAAWRESAQAVQAASARVRQMRGEPTVVPLVDGPWSERLAAIEAEAVRSKAAFIEASAWQARFVRPAIQACPQPPLSAAPGVEQYESLATGESAPLIAVLAPGDGYVCPGAARADGAVVLIDAAVGCWSSSPSCACDPAPIAPGAVLTAP